MSSIVAGTQAEVLTSRHLISMHLQSACSTSSCLCELPRLSGASVVGRIIGEETEFAMIFLFTAALSHSHLSASDYEKGGLERCLHQPTSYLSTYYLAL